MAERPVKKEAKNLEFQRQRDSTPVKGKFRFHESPGGTLKFPFKAYKKDEIKIYELTDGNIYTLPLGVARHLNKNCWYPVNKYSVNEDGTAQSIVGQKVQRCSFESLEFVDMEELEPAATSGIVTVKSISPETK